MKTFEYVKAQIFQIGKRKLTKLLKKCLNKLNPSINERSKKQKYFLKPSNNNNKRENISSFVQKEEIAKEKAAKRQEILDQGNQKCKLFSFKHSCQN